MQQVSRTNRDLGLLRAKVSDGQAATRTSKILSNELELFWNKHNNVV